MSMKKKKIIVILGIVLSVVVAALIITAIVLFTRQKNDTQPAFGNVVSYKGNIYYWKYSEDSFSSEESLWGYYNYRVDTINQLVYRNKNGEETVIVSGKGAENICIADNRIYYQLFISDNADRYEISEKTTNCKIMSCSLTGDDTKEHGDGVLFGLIEDGKYLIARDCNEYFNFSINTETMEITTISNDQLLLCSDDAVICVRYNNKNDSRMDDEYTLYAVSGDGITIKELHTELVSTLPSVVHQKENSYERLSGYCAINLPLIVNNKLFYLFENIDGTILAASGRIMSIDLDSGETSEILGSYSKEMGVVYEIDITSDDEDINSYKEYLINYCNLNALNKSDYSVFSDAEIKNFGDQIEILKAEYSESIKDKQYVFLTYGKFTKFDGWKSMFQFVKCALFEKNQETGECDMIYSSTDPYNNSDEAETGPIPIKAGDEIDCGDFLFSVPETWADSSVYKKSNDSIFFGFKDAQQPNVDINSNDWQFDLRLRVVDMPDPAEQPRSNRGINPIFNVAKLIQNGEEKLLEGFYSSTSSDLGDEHDYIVDFLEMFKTGLKAKPGTEIEFLDYSYLSDTVWSASVGNNDVYKLCITDVDTDTLSITMTYNGGNNASESVDGNVEMYGAWGYLRLGTANSGSAGSGFLSDGQGILKLTDDNRVIVSIYGAINPRYNLENGVTFDSIYIPTDEEIEYISGKIKESCDYFEISLPDCWEGLYTCERTADKLTFLHTESIQNWGGFLFSIFVTDPVEDITGDTWEIRRLITNEGEKYVHFMDAHQAQQYEPKWEEQYHAMEQGIDAALSTLKTTNPDIKMEKFFIGFTSQNYSGINANMDRYDLTLKRESLNCATGDIIFNPASGENSSTIRVFLFPKTGFITYITNDGATSGNGEIEIDGETIRLKLKDVNGDLPVDEGGVITLTPGAT